MHISRLTQNVGLGAYFCLSKPAALPDPVEMGITKKRFKAQWCQQLAQHQNEHSPAAGVAGKCLPSHNLHWNIAPSFMQLQETWRLGTETESPGHVWRS